MDRRTYLGSIAGGGSALLVGCLGDDDDDAEDGNGSSDDQDPNLGSIATEEVATGFAHPWGITPLPEEPAHLVTERPGELVRVSDEGDTREIDGVPEVYAEGQGGLLDVELHPAFPDEPWVYLTYAVVNGEGESATTLARGRLENGSLVDREELLVVTPFVVGEGHFGSRVGFDDDGSLLLTTGDRQLKQFDDEHYSQDLSNALGTIVRLEADGSIPSDNPFVDDPAAEDAIYAYGIRNSQGLEFHPESGEPWFSVHGEQGGDAIYVLESGANYGWPVAHYGCTYSGSEAIGDLPHEREDVVDPVHYWECNSEGFPPAGMTFYTGEAFPALQGDLLVGNLAGEYLGRFAVDGRDVTERDPLLADEGWRIRDVSVDPRTGELLVLVDGAEAPIVRLSPE